MTEKDAPGHTGPPQAERRRPAPGAEALVCPKCQGVMRTYVRSGLVIELCEDCRGLFLDRGELERLIEMEGGGWSGMLADPVEPTA